MINEIPSPPIFLKCPKCQYGWYSESKNIIVTCPNCHSNFKHPNIKEKTNIVPEIEKIDEINKKIIDDRTKSNEKLEPKYKLKK